MAFKSLLRPLSHTSKLRQPSSQFPRSSSASPFHLREASKSTSTLSSSTFPAQASTSTEAQYTHFGYENIPAEEKEQKGTTAPSYSSPSPKNPANSVPVGAVFSSVVTSYDRMNDLMSLGVHRIWKDRFVSSLNPGSHTSSPSTSAIPPPSWQCLDIAGGTGDIAFRILDHAHNINNSQDMHVTISDINPSMLSAGRARSLDTSWAHSPSLSFLQANAEDLHAVASNSIDLYTVAFGIRNFTDKPKALREAFRVLKPGGVFACLEFSNVTNPLLEAAYKRWSFGVIPLIGQLIAGDRESYQYLVESIERFPRKEEWAEMIREAGFVTPGKGWEDLTGGIAAIHKGIKPVE